MGTVGFIGGKFLPLHQGHAYAITEAACRCDELYVVLSHSPVRDQKLCEAAGMKPIPYEVRLLWLSTLTRYLAKIYNTVFVEEYGRTIYHWQSVAPQFLLEVKKIAAQKKCSKLMWVVVMEKLRIHQMRK